jgi:hypothetical protein
MNTQKIIWADDEIQIYQNYQFENTKRKENLHSEYLELLNDLDILDDQLNALLEKIE